MKGKGIAALVPFALLFTAFQIAPLVWMVIGSFMSDLDGWGLGNYRTIFSSPFYRQAMQFSLQLTFSSSLCGLLIATGASYYLHRLGISRLRDGAIAFTNMTSNFTGVSLAFAFIILLGANGCVTLLLRRYGWMTDFSLYSKTGLTVLYTYFQIPLGVLLLYPAFGAWRESAALLGASRLRFWLHIGLPVLTPALLGTFVILLANALGAYATLFALTTSNYNIIPIRISALVAGDLDLDPYLVSALGMVLVALMVLITLAHQLLVRRSYIRARP
ncbi:binding-protein-dependent transport systems inner membrane component [Candidatus Sodalis pierantonius str. SOPE]|uniref:Binding-protein-dependent transport systems inner membrane component n=1 Tax=Candidatus Sodalis pierantonii str. SOPE TaxID=2342 RepID=W0HLV4_9GAMM|nr:ABC transporter permease [Candidatus Sodalis pierantonius]AHF74871.1 binding-protein-dependent transport systems inner membrane component [Candidatus Sodalis pierantonius str. SOPE]